MRYPYGHNAHTEGEKGADGQAEPAVGVAPVYNRFQYSLSYLVAGLVSVNVVSS